MCSLYRILNRKAKKTGGTNFLDRFCFIFLILCYGLTIDRVVVPSVVGFRCVTATKSALQDIKNI